MQLVCNFPHLQIFFFLKRLNSLCSSLVLKIKIKLQQTVKSQILIKISIHMLQNYKRNVSRNQNKRPKTVMKNLVKYPCKAFKYCIFELVKP